GHLAGRDTDRLARAGMLPMATARALSLFDATASLDEPVAVLTPLDLKGDLPLLTGLGRRPAPAAGDRAAVSSSPLQGLAGLAAADQGRMLMDMVRAQAAIVLGHASPDAVAADRQFKDLGFDSLTAVEFRNRLAIATGLRLPATVIFDYPTPAAVAGYLRREIAAPEPAAGATALEELEKLETLMHELPAEDGLRDTLAVRVKALLALLERKRDGKNDADLEAATAETIFTLLDNELTD
ncbi:phosphopantetheine-binding protein, partial [Actinoplanes sp. NPDC049265]|uniref:phosphopantetheine-binding protein n=1 Tax=Actinoplanes sp. NPDC049265 TaxID=3363902 RepID=UPI00370FCCB5